MPTLLVDLNTSGNTTLLAAQGQYKIIRVTDINLTSNGVVTISLTSGGNTIWKTFATVVAGGGIVVPGTSNQFIDCPPNTSLVINLSAAVSVAGTINYTILGV